MKKKLIAIYSLVCRITALAANESGLVFHFNNANDKFVLPKECVIDINAALNYANPDIPEIGVTLKSSEECSGKILHFSKANIFKKVPVFLMVN